MAAAAIYDDRLERKGTAFLWRRGDRLCEPGEPLTGQVLWDEPEGYEPAERTGDEPIESEERYHGSTQVLITNKGGRDGGYTVSVNGKREEPDVNGVVRLKSFQGPFRVDTTDKDIVGPVTIGLLAKTGRHAPSVATVSVVQTTVMAGSTLPESVLQVKTLPCGNEQAVTLPALSFPYPARFTESPYVEIQSVRPQRNAEIRKWGSRFLILLSGLFMALLVAVGPAIQIGTGILGWLSTNLSENLINALGNWYEGNFLELSLFDKSLVYQFFTPVLWFFGVERRFVPVTQAAEAVISATLGTAGDDGTDAETEFGTSLIKAVTSYRTPGTAVKKYRKYTVRSLAQTLRNLAAMENEKEQFDYDNQPKDASAAMENASVSVRYASAKRNESVLAEYLSLGAGQHKRWFNEVTTIFQELGMGIFEKQLDAQGKAQMGLFLSTPGPAVQRGLQWQRLQQSYLATVLDVVITDRTGTWKVRIEADPEVGFAAGCHASGLVDDIAEFKASVRLFQAAHALPEGHDLKTTPLKITAACAACVNPWTWKTLYRWLRYGPKPDSQQRILNDYKATTKWWNDLVQGTNEVLSKGTDAFLKEVDPNLTAFKTGKSGGVYDHFMHRQSRERLLSAPEAIHRFRPQRVLSQTILYAYTNVDTIGVSGTDDNTEEVRDTLPISAAFDETHRAMRSYGLALKSLWDQWEASSSTRLVWYDLYEPPASAVAFENRLLNVAGSTGVAFCADGQLLPLQVRDKLEWWANANHGPEIEAAVRLISTKTPNTNQRAGTRSATEGGQAAMRPAPPETIAELLAAHAVADALIARVIMRTQLPESLRISTTAIGALRELMSRVIDVLRACRVDMDSSSRGMLSENDPLFACVLGGSDAARILHCLGAWTRRAHVSIAVDAVGVSLQLDNTREQRVALYNAWPVEAEAQFEKVLRVLERTTTLSLATMPIYALQNALTDDPICATREFDARLCEALASFGRTVAFGEALGLGAQALNPVRLRLAAHWPVVLAARLASKSTDAFRSRLTSLQTYVDDANPQLTRVADDEPLDAEVLRKRNGTLRIDLETLKDFREEHYTNDDVERDTQRFFVPFSHGHVPYSRVWSLVHPGSGGIDSAPVNCEALLEAIGQCLSADGDAQEPAAVRVAPLVGVDGAHPFFVQLQRSTSIDVACCLVVTTTTSATGASANDNPPLDFADAADAVLNGKNVLQRGSLVDVVCWNAERLVQAVLLAFGRVQPFKGRVTVDCVPPAPPMLAQEQLDSEDTEAGRKARVNASKAEVVDAVKAHRYALRKVCARLLEERQKCVGAYVKKLESTNANEKRVQADLIVDTTGALVEGVEAGIDDEYVAGLREMLQMMDIGASQAPTDVGYDVYTTGQAVWKDEFKAAFFNVETSLPSPSWDEALAYHCEHETERVYKLLKEKADEQYKTAEAIPNFNEDALDAQCPQLLPLADFKALAEFAVATQNVHSKRRDHNALLARLKEELTLLEVRRAAVEKDAGTIDKRNDSAFCASVVLASAILVAILGRTAAPRLRLAPPSGRTAPTWVGSLNAKGASGDLSLFEAAIVLEQAVRSSA